MDISYEHGLSHLSSCITTLPILVNIWEYKRPDDIVILSNGHAGLALYVVLEYFENKNAEELLNKYGVHPEKDSTNGIFCSTGSLGIGLPIAIGAALAQPDKTVWCVISDGECCEGSIWESLYFLSKNKTPNIQIFVNANGISAYAKVDLMDLDKKIRAFNGYNTMVIDTTNFLTRFKQLSDLGIESHYCKITNINTLQQLKYV